MRMRHILKPHSDLDEWFFFNLLNKQFTRFSVFLFDSFCPVIIITTVAPKQPLLLVSPRLFRTAPLAIDYVTYGVVLAVDNVFANH